MPELITTLHPINDDTTDLYPNVKNENIPPVISGKDAMEALEGDFSTLKTDEIQIGGENGTLINKDQIVTQNKVINLDEIVDGAELAQGLNGKVDKVQGKGLSTNDFTDAYKTELDNLPTALNGKVDKVSGKGLSTNDYTNADKTLLQVTIPNELSSLRAHILNLYRMVIRSGGTITVTDASVALASQPFPSTVTAKALLNYVGGMCQKVGDSIITAPVTMIVSKSFNLWDEEWRNGYYTAQGVFTQDNNYVASKNLVNCTPSTTYYINNNKVGRVCFYDKNGAFISTVVSPGNSLTTPNGCHYFAFDMLSTYGNTYNHDICINVFNTSMNGTYIPYRGNIYYPIHPDIQALEGYGYGLTADCNNYIDFERKKFVQMMARVNLGTLNFAYNSVYGVYSSSDLSALIKVPASQNTVSEAKAEKYGMTYQNNITNAEIGTMCIVANGNLFIRANEGDIISGYFYYPLKEPVETDISDLLRYTFPTYDIINVIAGGYLEFENENDIGVPYSVTYQYKPDAQANVLSIAPTAISEVDSNDPTDTI